VDPGTPLVTGYQAGVSKQLQVMAGASRGFADAGGHVARADLVRVEQRRHDLHPGWVGQADSFWSVPLAATLGIPIYLNSDAVADGCVPHERWHGPGAAFAFLMTGAGTSVAAISGMLSFTPLRSMAPNVGLKPTTPQKEAGRMIDPAVCVPIATASMLSAVAAADPLEEPPGVRFVSCGFVVHPG